MVIKYGKSQVTKMVDALDQDHPTIEDAALAALAAAETILEERAKFVIAGQLSSSKEHGHLDPASPHAIKVALAYYSTEGDARKAAESLWANTSTGDTFRAWVLPMFYGTPADLHTKQKEKYEKAEQAAKQKATERLAADREKRRAAMQARADGGKGSCETCGHQPFDHAVVGNSKADCRQTGCVCKQWKERMR